MFFDQLEYLCKKNNITVSGLAKQLGMSTGTIAKWKEGSIPNGETILKFSQYFNTSTDYLLTGKLQSSDLCKDEIEFLGLFRSLPESGKERVLGYIEGHLDALKNPPN